MIYNVKSIPQTYNGVNFRSRLEASWAAFFDQLNWQWEYEPFDLNGWLPDFKISCPDAGTGSLLVEVKPFYFPDDMPEIKKITAKIFEAYQGESLLLGMSPLKNDEGGIGYLLAPPELDNWNISEIDPAILNHAHDGHYDISAYYGSYHYRFSGEHDGDGHLGYMREYEIENLWKNARNITQWKKSK